MTATRPRRGSEALAGRWPLPQSPSGWLGVGLSVVAVLAAPLDGIVSPEDPAQEGRE
mgnify:CR=1 FL=1